MVSSLLEWKHVRIILCYTLCPVQSLTMRRCPIHICECMYHNNVREQRTEGENITGSFCFANCPLSSSHYCELAAASQGLQWSEGSQSGVEMANHWKRIPPNFLWKTISPALTAGWWDICLQVSARYRAPRLSLDNPYCQKYLHTWHRGIKPKPLGLPSQNN